MCNPGLSQNCFRITLLSGDMAQIDSMFCTATVWFTDVFQTVFERCHREISYIQQRGRYLADWFSSEMVVVFNRPFFSFKTRPSSQGKRWSVQGPRVCSGRRFRVSRKDGGVNTRSDFATGDCGSSPVSIWLSTPRTTLNLTKHQRLPCPIRTFFRNYDL